MVAEDLNRPKKPLETIYITMKPNPFLSWSSSRRHFRVEVSRITWVVDRINGASHKKIEEVEEKRSSEQARRSQPFESSDSTRLTEIRRISERES